MANQNLIGAQEVIDLLKISIYSLRDYRKRGLFVVAAKKGNKDLYDKDDILKRYTFIKERRRQGYSLSQISLLLNKDPVNTISLPSPNGPTAEMNNRELLHGFIGELYQKADPETKEYLEQLSRKWNIHFVGKNK
jgi:DNA-binding transcriptional MerR regulator